MGLLTHRGQITQHGPSTRISGAAATQIASAMPNPLGFERQSGELRWRSVGMSKKSALPAGYREGGAWSLPLSAGEMAATVTVGGTSDVAPLNLAGGLNADAALSGIGDLSATGQLLLWASATLSGIGDLSPAITGKLDAAAQLAGAGDVVAALGAIAGAVADIIGTGGLTAASGGIGDMAATILPFTELSPQSLAASVWNALVVEYDAAGSFGAQQVPVYTAKVALFDDDAGAADRYVVSWFKNGVVVTSGITSPTIHVVRAADGTDLIAPASMTEVGSLQRFRYDAAGGQRITAGGGYLVIVSATIDGVTRTWDQPVGRDSA